MRLNVEITIVALLLAGCGGRAGYSAEFEAAPHIATPPVDDQPEQQRNGPMIGGIESPRARVPVSSIDQGVQPPAELPQGAGPRGTSGEERYDEVGYAGSFEGGSVSSPYAAATVIVAHPSLPIGSYVELTALDSGRTIVALVSDRAARDEFIGLSPGAADELGVVPGAALRVRLVTPSQPDQMALRSGHAASRRIDAPDGLLKALRHRLPGHPPVATRAPYRKPPPVARTGAEYAPPPERADTPVARGSARFVVQVGAFSTREHAQTAARQVGGRISAAGGLFRVQMGPYADAASAQRGRDEAAARGYGDARVMRIQ